MKEIQDKIKQLLFENGICFDEDDLDGELEMDSLVYMSFLVGLEENLGIVIPDEVLVHLPTTYFGLVEMVTSILNLGK